MFYLTTHSTHFIYGSMEVRKCFISQRTQHILFTVLWKEGNVLFNDALNTFYLRFYGRKEGNVLFHDALKTFYLQFYRTTHSSHYILRLYGVEYKSYFSPY